MSWFSYLYVLIRSIFGDTFGVLARCIALDLYAQRLL